jgi:hypothetical protein
MASAVEAVRVMTRWVVPGAISCSCGMNGDMMVRVFELRTHRSVQQQHTDG